MKYVCNVCGWEYDEEKVILKAELSRVRSGKIFRMILNARYAQ